MGGSGEVALNSSTLRRWPGEETAAGMSLTLGWQRMVTPKNSPVTRQDFHLGPPNAQRLRHKHVKVGVKK